MSQHATVSPEVASVLAQGCITGVIRSDTLNIDGK
jgi:hypothetical protein